MLIFGIIAAMLIPNVASNAEKTLFVTQLKKVQNDIQQAMIVIMSENQGTLLGLCSDANASQCFRDEIVGSDTEFARRKGKLEKLTNFGSDTLGLGEAGNTCNDHSEKKDLANPCNQKRQYVNKNPLLLNKSRANQETLHDTNNFFAANLTNGATMRVHYVSACNMAANLVGGDAGITGLCGFIEVDLNAGKAPNTVGKDIHYFWINPKDGIIPFGEYDNDFTCGAVNGNNWTLPTKTNSVKTQYGCTYRALNSRRGIDYY